MREPTTGPGDGRFGVHLYWEEDPCWHMADKTISEDRLSREEAADRLRAIADELDGEGDANVRVGNKTISLHPSGSVGYEIGVRERSSILRGTRESISLTLDWKPQ